MKSQAESRTPRQRYRDTLRREILDAAREAFLKDGYAGVSVRKLAEAVGCSHGNLYLHFEDKEALFDCLVEEAFVEFGASLDALSQSVRRGDPVEGMRRMGRAYVAFGLSNPSAYEFAFVLRRPGQRQQPHVPYERVRSLVQRCVDEKRFRPTDIDVASQSLWAAAHGITSLLILRPGFPWADRDKLIAQVIDAAVDGLLA
jgi:AcrR family transcriptional regulator